MKRVYRFDTLNDLKTFLTKNKNNINLKIRFDLKESNLNGMTFKENGKLHNLSDNNNFIIWENERDNSVYAYYTELFNDNIEVFEIGYNADKQSQITYVNDYDKLLQRDNTHEEDLERKALFYILSHNKDLFDNVDYIYDFEKHEINPFCLGDTKIDFSDNSKILIKLAFNLYNPSHLTDIHETFNSLDRESFHLAMESIKIRFGQDK